MDDDDPNIVIAGEEIVDDADDVNNAAAANSMIMPPDCMYYYTVDDESSMQEDFLPADDENDAVENDQNRILATLHDSQQQAEAEGIAETLTEAGFEWREPGCSMCLAMNTDKLEPGERCASTTNRNFQGRQGRDGRTHLVSPAMAAAAAVTGRLTDVRELIG